MERRAREERESKLRDAAITERERKISTLKEKEAKIDNIHSEDGKKNKLENYQAPSASQVSQYWNLILGTIYILRKDIGVGGQKMVVFPYFIYWKCHYVGGWGFKKAKHPYVIYKWSLKEKCI